MKYGITQAQMTQYRAALQAGQSYGYLMAQLALTYNVRKVMHGLR